MISIVVAEDQEMLLGVIGSLLNLEEDMEVVGHARNGKEAIALVQQLQPDVCIMDIEMLEMSGLEAAEALLPERCKVIILTTFAKKGYFQRVLSANVKGYLLKDSPSEQLVCCIRSIVRGTQIFSPELMDDDQTKSEPSINQRKKARILRHYFSSIIDKMKLPTG